MRRGRAGFDFLGFHHRVVKSWRWQGRWYLNKWPSSRAMKAIRLKVKDALGDRRSVLSQSLDDRVRVVNPVLRGWGQYFRIGNSSRKFAQIDYYVYYRFALFDRKKHQRAHVQGAGSRFHQALAAAGLYRLSGTVRYVSVAHAPR